jgi:hypothetical protein
VASIEEASVVKVSFDAASVELVAEEVERQLPDRQDKENGRSPWITAAEAAEYLRWPLKRLSTTSPPPT